MIILLGLVSGCTAPQATQALITINITADGETFSIPLPPGSTVQQALDAAGIKLNTADRIEPQSYTILREGTDIQVIRVTEKFEVEEETIPFERQTLQNESLAKDKEVLLQGGSNGLREITYRRVFEDGVEVSSQPIPVKAAVVEEPVPEIRMVGIQAPFATVPIPGKLYYLRDGNVWVIEETTGNRSALITTGDLDGRVLSISDDGSWLLFTRSSSEEDVLNSLWAAKIAPDSGDSADNTAEIGELISLEVDNVVHFADWAPGSNTKVLFSTVEPRATAPGWQANNDLNALTFSNTGWTTDWTVIVESNAGGVYGWWGTDFAWGPDQEHFTYTRPDGIGLVNYKTGTITNTMSIIPFQTRGDWAWVPGITWGPDSKILYTIDHVFPEGAPAPEESQNFDLTALSFEGGPLFRIVSQVGMFAYPLASPIQTLTSGEIGYQIAFLLAEFPNQSETSRYRLVIMDRDGSNRRELFPPEGTQGLEPQKHWGTWSPTSMPESGNYAIAVLHHGNLWLIDSLTGESLQVTGDGLTSRLLWK